MPAAGNWATGLGAVRDAIEFYMRLREQRYDRDRMSASDARADRQLKFTEEEALRDNQRADEESVRRRIEFQATNFGGNEIPQTDAAQWRRLGYGSALEEQQTLPAYQKGGMPILQDTPGAPTGTPSPLKTIQQYSAQVPTGKTTIRQPESERMRIAYYNAMAANQRQDANIQSRERISSQNLAMRQRQIDAMLQRSDAQMALQRYGIDVRDTTARMQLSQLIAMNSALVQDREWDNMFVGGPLAMMRFITPEGIQMPSNRPLYYDPPTPGGGGAGAGAGGDWEVVP